MKSFAAYAGRGKGSACPVFARHIFELICGVASMVNEPDNRPGQLETAWE